MARIELERAGTADRLRADAEPWVEGLARLGYAAKGVVYVLVGAIGLDAARDLEERATGSRGALQSILGQPFGKVLLGVIAVGLAGYALWKLTQAALDPGGEGTDTKGILKRLGFAVAGVVYAGLAFAAARLAMGNGGGAGPEGDGTAVDRWTAFALEKPLGRWIVVAAGVGIALYGLYQLYKAVKAGITREMDLSELSSRNADRVVLAARLGMAARAVVFGIIGWFLVQAALHHNASEARGMGGALRVVEGQRYGSWLLVAVAVGLIAYGVLEMVKARYHRIFDR